MIKTCDTFDAARVLLVSGYSETGESLVAPLIPDRDTLVLTSPPSDGDWTGLRKLARTPAGDALCPEPLVVTRSRRSQGGLTGHVGDVTGGGPAPSSQAGLQPIARLPILWTQALEWFWR